MIAKVGSVDDVDHEAPRFVAADLVGARNGGASNLRTPGDVARKVFDLVENATWRAANFQMPTREEVNKVVQERLGDVTGAVIERTYRLMEMANRMRGGRKMTYDEEHE